MEQTDTVPAHDGTAHFDAVLIPHRSLGPRGFLIFMLAVGAFSFAAGIAFLVIGAWPVFGFFGLDVLLIYIAFRLNYRSARAYETVRLTDDALTVERYDVRGRCQRWQFQPYWLSVLMDDPPQPDSRLTLRSHGRSLVIGLCLTPDERLDFARALRKALAEWRRAPFAAPHGAPG